MSMLANCVNVGLILLLGVVREYLGGFAPALALSSVCVLLLLLWGRSINWKCREE